MTPQVCLGAIYPKPAARASGKKGRFPHLKLAADLARQLGMVPSWPNLQIIRLAIESEAEYSEITIPQAAALIAQAAVEFTSPCGSVYRPPDWRDEVRAFKANRVDRFWFEDARWRTKAIYDTMLARLQRESA